MLNAVEGTLVFAVLACVGSLLFAASLCGFGASAGAGGYSISVTSKVGIVFKITRDFAGVITRICDVTLAVARSGGCAGVVANLGFW